MTEPPTHALASTLELDADIVCTPMPDGTGVLMHIATQDCVTLNTTALKMWTSFAEGQTLERAAVAIADGYAISTPDARVHVHAFAEQLVQAGFARYTGLHAAKKVP